MRTYRVAAGCRCTVVLVAVLLALLLLLTSSAFATGKKATTPAADAPSWSLAPLTALAPAYADPEDLTPPYTSDDSDGLWHAAAVTVHFTATDFDSPATTTFFQVDGGLWQAGTQVTVSPPRKRPTESVFTITYYSVDGSGNAEQPKSCPVRIDCRGPLSSDNADGLVHPSDTVIGFDAADNGSGVAELRYSVDGGAWQTLVRNRKRWPGYRATIFAPGNEANDGTHVLIYYGVDRLGNVGTRHTCAVTIDAPHHDPIHVSGTLSADTFWDDQQVYVVDGTVTVPTGVRLTVAPYGLVKFAYSSGLNVAGRLLAQGTAFQPVIVTSYQDDSYAGDTNGDGISSTPWPGNWAGISFAANSDGSVLDHVKIDYGEYGVQASNASFALTNSEVAFFRSGGVYISTTQTKSTPAGVTIQNNTIRDGNDTGIYAWVGNDNVNSVTPQTPVISGNTISGNQGQGIHLSAHSITSAKATLCQPTIENNVISGNGAYANQWALEVHADLLSPTLSTNTGSGNLCQAMALSGTIAGNWTWPKNAALMPLLVADSSTGYGVTVPAGKTLTMQAGAVVKSNYSWQGTLNVKGILLAQGTVADPVIFTSYQDDSYAGDTNGDGISSTPAPGDWGGVAFGANSDGSVLDHVKIDYGYYGVQAQNASFTLTNSEVAISRYFGVYSTTDQTKSTPAGVTIQNNTIRDGNDTGIYAWVGNDNVNSVTPQTPVISGNTISGNQGQGIHLSAHSITSAKATLCQPTIENNVISGNGAYANQWALEVHADLLSPTLSTNTGSGNLCQAMALSGTIAGNWTWPKNAALMPLLVADSSTGYGVTVPAGKTLTMQAGAVVKSNYSWQGTLNVKGILLAQGTVADPVIFTSYQDDSYAGDTNGDGISSTPAPGDWGGVAFGANSDGSVLDHVKIDYGYYGVQAQNASFTLTNSEVAISRYFGVYSTTDQTKSTPAGVTIQNNTIRDGNDTGIYAWVGNDNVNSVTPQTPVISGNTISGNQGQGIHLSAHSITSAKATLCQPTIENNVISGNGAYANQWALEVHADLLSPTLSTNTGSGNLCQAMALSGTIAGNWTWPKNAALMPLLVADSSTGYGVTVPAGKTLTMQAGAVVKSNYSWQGTLNVKGILLAQGTVADPVIFTSYQDDSYAGDTNGDGISSTPAPGDWGGVAFGANSDGSVLDHVKIDYGYYGVQAQNASFRLTNSVIKRTSASAITLNVDQSKSTTAGAVIQDNAILQCAGSRAVSATITNNTTSRSTPTAPTITGNTIDQCPYGGLYFYGSSASGGVALPVTANVSGNQVTNCGGSFDGSVAFQIDSDRLLASVFTNTGSGNTGNALEISGTLTQNATMAKGAALTPVVFSRGLTVGSSATLTVSAGAVVKSAGPGITVSGQLVAVATTSDRTWLTSFRDDSVGGDTNGDGVASSPSTGDWSGFTVAGTANMQYCTLAYAGTGITNQETGHTSITNSSLKDCQTGITNSTTAPLVHAENDWWGSDSGPSPYGDGASIAWHTEYDSWSRPYAVFDVDADPWVGKQYGWAPNFGMAGWGGYAADPVNVTIGNYTYANQDFSIASRGLPLEVVRSYNSSSGADSPFGYGWAFSYGLKLAIDEVHDWVLVTREDGRVVRFVKEPDASYTSPAGEFDVLTKDAVASTYALTSKDQTVDNFDASGKLTSVVDRNGNTTALSYDGSDRISKVTAPDGRTLTFAVDAGGHITSVTDPASRIWHYAYSAAGDLLTTTDPLGTVTTCTYDSAHRLLTMVDANGHTVVTNTYDDGGRCLTQLDAKGCKTTYAYNIGNKTTDVTDALGNTTSYVYDQQHRIVSTTSPLGATTTNTYDDQNNKTSVADALDNTTVYSYDYRGNQLSATNPKYDVSTTSYDTQNNPVSTMDYNGRVSTFHYDAHGNLTKQIDPAGYQVTHTYDQYGEVVSTTDQLSNTTTFAFDDYGNLQQTTLPNGAVSSATHDIVGRTLTSTNALGKTTSFTYDTVGRLLSVTDPLSHSVATTYDAVGDKLTVTDANGNLTTYAYDSRNDLVKVTDALGHDTTYTYDANRHKTLVTDANAHATAYDYDADGRLTKVTDALSRSTTTGYDASGNRTSSTDALGQTTTYIYDSLNRLTTVHKPDGTDVSYGYDANGNKVSVADSLGLTSYVHDELGRLTSCTTPDGKTVSYTYDGAGRRAAVTYPDGKSVAYSYDDVGQLAKVVDYASRQTTYAYRADGSLLSVTLPNGIVSTRSYDNAGRLTSIAYAKSAVAVLTLTYTLDANGNRTALVDSLAGTTGYEYDALNRLTRENAPSRDVRLSYDPTGNRASKTVNGGAATTYTYDAGDQLQSAGTTTYTNNDDGSRASKTVGSDTTTYDYTSDNMLSGVTTPTTTAIYEYNGDNQRVAVTLGGSRTSFVLDQTLSDEAVLQETTGATTATYVYGAGLISRQSASGIVYYLTDALGSTRLVTNGSGTVTGSCTYDAFGSSLTNTDASGNRFGFTGQWADIDGLTFLRARFYDSATGRFLSVDPVSGSATDPQTLNAYVYCADNPIMNTDAGGESLWSSIKDDWSYVKNQGQTLKATAMWAWDVCPLGKLPGAVKSVATTVVKNTYTAGQQALHGQYQAALNTMGNLPRDVVVGLVKGYSGWTAYQDTLVMAKIWGFQKLGYWMGGLVYGGGDDVDCVVGGPVHSAAGGGGIFRTAQGRYAQAVTAGGTVTYQSVQPPVFHPYTFGRPFMPMFTK